MSQDDLTTLLTRMAEEVDRMPQREYSARAWDRAGQLRRRRVAVGAAAVVLLVGVPVAVVALRGDPPVGPAEQVVSQTPLRARAGHTATVLGDGRVLIVGGCATDGCTTAEGAPSTEYYVAGQGFTPGPELIQPRQGHSATLLPDGRVLIVGGWAREGTGALDSAEVYDPATSRFESVGSLGEPRGGHIAVALRDGRVLIAGGEETTSSELFDPRRNEFMPAAPMPEPRFAAPAIALADGRVLVVGGRDSASDPVASALLYDPATDTWQATGSMSTARDKHALATLPDGRILVMGGTVDDRHLFDTTEIYDPGTGQFAPGPKMDMGRYKLTATVDAEGRIIVVGGTEAAIYDAGKFTAIPGTAGPIRWVATVTALPDGDVLIVGGYDDRIRLLGDALLVSPGQPH